MGRSTCGSEEAALPSKGNFLGGCMCRKFLIGKHMNQVSPSVTMLGSGHQGLNPSDSGSWANSHDTKT